MNKHVAILIGAFVAGCLSTAFLVTPLSCGQRSVVAPIFQPPVAGAVPEWLTQDEKNSVTIFEQVSRSAVFVVNKAYVRNFFSRDLMEVRRGAGTGFVWDTAGHVVTNYHVIHEGQAFSVILTDNSAWEAEVIGQAPEKDLAVLKVKAPPEKLIPVVTGSSAGLRVGQKVLAIGNPFGLDQTLTTGVVSAIGREIKSISGRTIYDVVQTDAAINPGNSGGPLLDSQGRLIGVNTAIYSPSGAYAGIGFAVPVDTVKQVVPMLIKYGRFMRPSLGMRTYSDATARNWGKEGVIIADVPRTSAAARAGLRGTTSDRSGQPQLGDIVVAVDGEDVKNYDDLLNVLEKHKVNDRVTVTYIRNGEKRTTKATLQERPE